MYDPSNSNYEITQDNNGYNISTYQYDGEELFSTTRNSPIMIWNVRNSENLVIFNSETIDEHAYNKKNECNGALATLVDYSPNAKYFRKGLRMSTFTNREYFLIGTNTHLSGKRIPEYKPFYFFSGGELIEYLQRTRKISDFSGIIPRTVDQDDQFPYRNAIKFFILFLYFTSQFNASFNIKNKLLALIFMRGIDALRSDSFDEKFLQHSEKLVLDAVLNYYGFPEDSNNPSSYIEELLQFDLDEDSTPSFD